MNKLYSCKQVRFWVDEDCLSVDIKYKLRLKFIKIGNSVTWLTINLIFKPSRLYLKISVV